MRLCVTLCAELPGNDPDIAVEVQITPELAGKLAQIGGKNLAEHPELRLLAAAVRERSGL